MAGRITGGMMRSQLLYNLNNNLGKLSKFQLQMETGKVINKPSDDPVGITYSLRYRSDFSANIQFRSTVDSGLSQLDYADDVLDQIGKEWKTVRTLAVKAANSTNDETAMDAIKTELEELYDELVSLANNQFQGRYIFNGQKTDIKPYDPATAETAATDNGEILFEMSEDLKIQINITGNEVFGSPGDADNLFKVMKDLINDIDNNDHQAVSDALDIIDSRNSKLLDARAAIGGRTNRVELVQDRLEDLSVNLEDMQSNVEDADITELITRYTMTESVYRASLAVGSRSMTPTLVDFLN
ncbi:flagellar hook-associated protein FlgL [Longirhabdus pacifica]|uniref:flagellar hook-associated protein FlgL n=1 Tax=Longirhabdus pacifica TaxID=2305227 RepID=UPI0013E8CAA4|nr:flagellar hook-associated protein FlgL [Longirhabdus pacifica]